MVRSEGTKREQKLRRYHRPAAPGATDTSADVARERAAQFSPFAALTGHSAAIAETGRLTDSRVILDEYEMSRVDDALQKLQELLPQKPMASITYFVPDAKKAGGAYQTIHGTVKRIDAVNDVLLLTDQRAIPITDIFDVLIESSCPTDKHSFDAILQDFSIDEHTEGI